MCLEYLTAMITLNQSCCKTIKTVSCYCLSKHVQWEIWRLIPPLGREPSASLHIIQSLKIGVRLICSIYEHLTFSPNSWYFVYLLLIPNCILQSSDILCNNKTGCEELKALHIRGWIWETTLQVTFPNTPVSFQRWWYSALLPSCGHQGDMHGQATDSADVCVIYSSFWTCFCKLRTKTAHINKI